MTIIIDTDALIGLLVSTDEHYAQANALQQQTQGNNAKILLLSSTLGEFGSVAANMIGLSLTQRAVQTFVQGYTLLPVDDQITRNALPLYYQQTSKKNSLFDCYVL